MSSSRRSCPCPCASVRARPRASAHVRTPPGGALPASRRPRPPQPPRPPRARRSYEPPLRAFGPASRSVATLGLPHWAGWRGGGCPPKVADRRAGDGEGGFGHRLPHIQPSTGHGGVWMCRRGTCGSRGTSKPCTARPMSDRPRISGPRSTPKNSSLGDPCLRYIRERWRPSTHVRTRAEACAHVGRARMGGVRGTVHPVQLNADPTALEDDALREETRDCACGCGSRACARCGRWLVQGEGVHDHEPGLQLVLGHGPTCTGEQRTGGV